MHSQETRIFAAILTSVIILIILMSFFVITIIRYSKKKIASNQEKIISDTIILEKERERIAADLHDDLGATLSAIKIKLQCLDVNNTDDSSIVEEVQNLIDISMKKLRQISYNVMPLILRRKGLREALNEMIETIGITNKLKIKLDYNIGNLSKEKELHIFRILQEIISNVLKHANATDVNIIFKEAKRSITVQVVDNGIGFSKNEVLKNEAGIGLQNIMARVQMLNGTGYLTTENGVDYLIEIPKSL